MLSNHIWNQTNQSKLEELPAIHESSAAPKTISTQRTATKIHKTLSQNIQRGTDKYIHTI